MIGFDFLGLAHPQWPIRETLIATPAGAAIGCFDDPFGDVIPHLRRLLLTNRYPAVRIHAHWADNHAIVPLDKLRKKLPRYEQLARDVPAVKFYVSHSCEYHEPDQEKVKQRVAVTRQLAPSCIPVDCPMNSPVSGDAIVEHHGDVRVRPGEICSTDGASIYDIDAERYVSQNTQATICFLWGARFNFREIAHPGQKAPPPRQRTAAPTREYLRAVVRLASPAGSAPDAFPGARPFASPRLYKPFAEDMQGVASARENKPVIILPVKVLALQVLASNGEMIAKLGYGGTYQGGMHRYYSPGAYGFQLGVKALRASGSEFVWFKAGGAIYGPVNPAFRAGFFR